MPAQLLLYHPWLQEPLEAGWITPLEAWRLDLDCLISPQGMSPLLVQAWSRLQLFHEDLPMQ